MAFRFYGSAPAAIKPNLFPLMEHVFTTIGGATVGGSAEESRKLGFLRASDRVTLNPDNVIADAKADVLAMLATGYQPPRPGTVPVPGRDGIATLKIGLHGMRGGGYISEYDEYLGRKLAHVICGGDVPPGTERSEQDFLDLERATILELFHEEKTLARMQHMLSTGKPLRN
jgi:3-hydroxyacyl-CoA dehydrogenase